MSKDLGARVGKFIAFGERTGGGSNYDAMCEALSQQRIRTNHASVRCRACQGQGYYELTVDELQRRNRKLGELEDLIALAEVEIKDAYVRNERLKDHRERLRKLRQELSRDSDCKACRGVGWMQPTRADLAVAMHSMWTTVVCTSCRGCGEPIGDWKEVRANAKVYRFSALCPTDETAERGDTCERCAGIQYLTPVTVKETGSSKGGRPPEYHRPADADDDSAGAVLDGDLAPTFFDEDALVERGRVSRILEGIRRDKPEIAEALVQFYGPEGDKWGHHKWGRVFALWPLTQAGKKLAEFGANRSKDGHGWLMAPIDLIMNERDGEIRAERPMPARRALIAQADRQARELELKMREALSDTEAA